MKIGIGYTTHNRREVLENSLNELKQRMPTGAKLVIVDDASDEPFKRATFRFDENVGIARAKNKCLELLDDCEHIFLFDDDTYPKADNWWVPYVEGDEPHYCYIFLDLINQKLNDSYEIYSDSKLRAFTHPRGCMLYLERRVLDVVGGMDQRYRRWGFEHVDFSNRIYNSGLTSFRFQDVPQSSDLIYSGDEQETVVTTVPAIERRKYLAEMREHYNRSFESKEFCEYKPPAAKDTRDQNNVVLTVYFTGQPDPERNITWDNDIEEKTVKLVSSVKLPTKMVLFHDTEWQSLAIMGADYFVDVEKVETSLNPYFQRWFTYWQYLRDNPDIDNVFCVDATDVDMLRSPFPWIEPGKLHIGDENEMLGCAWMLNHHRVEPLWTFMRRNRNKQLLNAGIVGGSREIVMSFIHDMLAFYFDNRMNVGSADMGTLNYIAYTKYADKIVHGRQVNTLFKGYEDDNGVSWWRHK